MGVSAGSLLPLWDLVILVLLLIFSSYCFFGFLSIQNWSGYGCSCSCVFGFALFSYCYCYILLLLLDCVLHHLGWWQQPAYRNWTCPKGSSLQLGLIWSPRPFRTFQPWFVHRTMADIPTSFGCWLLSAYYGLVEKSGTPKTRWWKSVFSQWCKFAVLGISYSWTIPGASGHDVYLWGRRHSTWCVGAMVMIGWRCSCGNLTKPRNITSK